MNISDAMMELEDCGFCLSCLEIQENVEPDATHRECENCGDTYVFGCETLVIMENNKFLEYLDNNYGVD